MFAPSVFKAIPLMSLAFLLAACTTMDPVPPPPIKNPFTYVVGPGDRLEIEVWQEPDLKRTVTVTPDGHITFPLLTGAILVRDRTIPEIAEIIHARLLEVIKEPFVTVTLAQSLSSQVQVWGEVGSQGPVPFRDRLSLIGAIGDAGGLNWVTAKVETVRIVRGALDDPIIMDIDLENVLIAAEKDVFLEPGDIVMVPAKYVTRWDRYMSQLLNAITQTAGTARTVESFTD